MARSTNGTSDYVDCGIVTALSGLTQATYAAWIYRASTSDTAAFGQYKAAGRFALLWYTDGTVYNAAEDGSASAYNTFPLAGSGWKHFVTVYDGTQSTAANRIAFYVNGAAVTSNGSGGASLPASIATGGNQSAWRFGCDDAGSGNRFWGGAYAECGIWTGLLTQADITSLANGCAPDLVRPSTLVAYWPLIGRQSPEVNAKNSGNVGTLTGTSNFDHPRIFYGLAGRTSLGTVAAPTNKLWTYYAMQHAQAGR